MSLFDFLFKKPVSKEEQKLTEFKALMRRSRKDEEELKAYYRSVGLPNYKGQEYYESEPVQPQVVQVKQVSWWNAAASAASLYTAYSVNKKMNELQEKLKQAEATKPKYDPNTGLRKYV